MTNTLFKIVAAFWVIWGLVHMLAGGMFMSLPSIEVVTAIADKVAPAAVANDVHHPAVGAIFNQHGFNLAWIGLVTTISAFFIFRQNTTALWVAAMAGGLADVGYFTFLDLGGYVKFLPGGMMTFVSGSAILISAYIAWTRRRAERA